MQKNNRTRFDIVIMNKIKDQYAVNIHCKYASITDVTFCITDVTVYMYVIGYIYIMT
jgi:hypothetical protein